MPTDQQIADVKLKIETAAEAFNDAVREAQVLGLVVQVDTERRDFPGEQYTMALKPRVLRPA